MQADSINDLKYYISKDVLSKIEKVDIHSFIKFDVKIKEDKIFEILIAYYDSNKQVGFCFVHLKIDKRNRIRVVGFKPKPSVVIKIKNPEKVFSEVPPVNEKGIIPLSFEEMTKIIKKYDS